MHANPTDMCEPAVSRRNFLGAAAIGATAVLLPSLSDGAEKPQRWQMKLSTSTIQFTRLPVEEAFERIAKLGFDAVDVWSAHANCPHLDDVANRLGAKGLVECAKKNEIALYAYSVYRGGYPKYAKLIGEAGGGVAIHGATKACKPAELTAKMKAYLESMTPEIELAEQYDSYIALENHGGNILNTLDGLKAFVDNNKSKRLGIALAPFHLQGAKVPVPEAISVVGDQLFFFYAWQRAKGTEQLPGIGPTDFTPWIAALAEIDYKWYVNPFMHHEPEPDAMVEALEKSRQYLLDNYERACPA